MPTEILKTVLFNGQSARILSHLVYDNGDDEYSISQFNLFIGKEEYQRFFPTLKAAEEAF